MIVDIDPATQYVLLSGLSSIIAMALGIKYLLPQVSATDVVRELVETDWRYLGVAWVASFGVNELAKYHTETMFTDTIHALEGGTVAVFQSFVSTPLTVFFAIVYLVGFPFIVLFTYFKLKHSNEMEAYRYALSYVIILVLSAPFFLFFPVGVTGHTLPQVEYLLFDLGPTVRAGITATDTLVKAFPSLHAGLSVLAALYAREVGETYKNFAWGLTALIILSTLYLGVHWLTDLVLGVALVGIAYLVAQQVEDPRFTKPVMDRLSRIRTPEAIKSYTTNAPRDD